MAVMTIAVDGPAGAGKSTVAKAVAERLDIPYLDTGAMYRALGLSLLREGLDLTDRNLVALRCGEAPVKVVYIGGEQRTLLGEEDVTEEIRSAECSRAASLVSAVPEVRARMVALQREIAAGNSVVMDGRDIGTRVLPNARVKIFLTARPEVRARRRCGEMREKGQEADYETVLKDIVQRDYQDTHREASPLQKAEDAFEVDTSELTLEEVIERVTQIVRNAQ